MAESDDMPGLRDFILNDGAEFEQPPMTRERLMGLLLLAAASHPAHVRMFPDWPVGPDPILEKTAEDE